MRRAGAALAALGIAVTGCGGVNLGAGPAAQCADAATLETLKEIIFDEARKQSGARNRLALPELARASTLTIDLPVLDGVNEQTRKITCSGTARVRFPDGAYVALGAEEASTDVTYSIQPAADGSGNVYTLEGAGEIVLGIAVADLSLWTARRQPTSPAAASAGSETPVAGNPTVAPVAESLARSAPTPPPPRPSVEALIRNDPSLVSRERGLAGLYQNALDRDVTGRVRREHAQALTEREGCTDVQCLSRWFDDREADLEQWQR